VTALPILVLWIHFLSLFFADFPNGRLMACRDFLNGRTITFHVPFAALLKNHAFFSFLVSVNFSTFCASGFFCSCFGVSAFGASGFDSGFFSSALMSLSASSCHLYSLFRAWILSSHAEAPG